MYLFQRDDRDIRVFVTNTILKNIYEIPIIPQIGGREGNPPRLTRL